MTRRRHPVRPTADATRALQHLVTRLTWGRALNVALITPLLTPACHLRIGNDAPSLGRDRVVRDLARFVRGADGIGLGYFDGWRCHQTLILELDCIMSCPNGLRVTVPFSAILRLTDGLVDDIRIYIDRAGPLPVTH